MSNQGEIKQHFGDVINVNTTAVSASLNRLIGLLTQPEALVHLAVFRERFQNANQLIHLLADCKKLHDHLHRLQLHCLSPILLGTTDFPNNTLFLDNLFGYVEDFRTNLSGIREVMQRLALNAFEMRWVGKLEQAQTKLDDALGELSKTSLGEATALMRREIGRQQEQANTQLKSAARSLLALHLADTVTQVKAELMQHSTNADVMRQYDDGITALAQFGRSLDWQIEVHDRWQEIANALWLVEDKPEETLRLYWPDMLEILAPILAAPNDDFVVRFQVAFAKLEGMLHEPAPPAQASLLRRAFFDFRSQANTCFFLVDKRLLDLCTALLRVGPQLDELLLVIPATRT